VPEMLREMVAKLREEIRTAVLKRKAKEKTPFGQRRDICDAAEEGQIENRKRKQETNRDKTDKGRRRRVTGKLGKRNGREANRVKIE